ncbi:MAG TPA: arginine repressor [Clostridiales bacterium]|jgi:transcriptional regulator of arginine metabolism|nr:arginine repressor [Clostridiales bacterium]
MRNARQKKIIEIIESVNIETQKELAEHLRSCGFNVTQTTVSRDIKELKLVKVLSDNGISYRYAIADTKQHSKNTSSYKSLFASSVTSIVPAGNLVVVKTLPGAATMVAKALDSIKYLKILGSVAGYDTLFIATKGENESKLVKEQLEEVIAKNNTR